MFVVVVVVLILFCSACFCIGLLDRTQWSPSKIDFLAAAVYQRAHSVSIGITLEREGEGEG